VAATQRASDLFFAGLATAWLVIAVAVAGINPSSATDSGFPGGMAGTIEAQDSPASVPAGTKRNVTRAYGKLPLSFIPNKGQTHRSVRYYAQGAGHAFYFTRRKAVLSFADDKGGVALHLTPLGANPNPTLQASDRRSGKVNYLIGRERHTNLPTYRQLTYRELWPGIDMVFRDKGGTLKYEFRLRPGANVSDIRLAYQGADGVSLGAAGNLLVQTPLGAFRDSRPRSFQRMGKKQVAVRSRYVLAKGENTYGFALGVHRPDHPLVIDPGLTYSTYLGGVSSDDGIEIAVDANGAAYVTGWTLSPDFPTSAGAYDTGFNGANGSHDAFITKLNASGSALVYSTFLGGASGDQGSSIAVDGSGAVYVTGRSDSTNFPTTAGAYDTTRNGDNDAFVTKLSPSGSALMYSSYLGGPSYDSGSTISVDGSGAAYVTGYAKSSGFPVTAGAYDTTHNGGFWDGFVTKLSPSGSALMYSTYLGGASSDVAIEIAVDASGAAYVTGFTDSSGFPITAGAYDTTHNGSEDVWVAKLNPSGSALAYSTYLGGLSYETPSGIVVDASGNAYVSGYTQSSDFSTSAGAYDTSFNGAVGDYDAFITKLNPSGSALVYSTYLGGASEDWGLGITVDGSGAAYLTGRTQSSDFPTSAGAYDTTHNGGWDIFVTKLSAFGSALIYSTYSGGTSTDEGNAIAIDASGAAYLTGRTSSSDFPTTAGAYDTSSDVTSGVFDAFVTKLKLVPTGAIGQLSQLPETAGCVSETGSSDCTDGNALLDPLSMAASGDAKSVYLASNASDAVSIFQRDTTSGQLAELGCVSETGTGGACADAKALDAASSVALSPDGKNVYVASTMSDAVAVLRRDTTTGQLTQLSGVAGCVSETGSGGSCADGKALDGARSVTVSPNGNHVYVTSLVNDAVAAFQRNASTGRLFQLAGKPGCISETGSSGACTDGRALDGPVSMRAFGTKVYVASLNSDAVALLSRNSTTGELSQAAGTGGCVSETGSGGTCADGKALDAPRSLAVSVGGKNLYVASFESDAVATFQRDTTTGALTQLAGTGGCVSETGSGGACANGKALDGAHSVAVSGDGASAYVASSVSDAVAAFSRGPTVGRLTQLAAARGCVSETGTWGACADGRALDGARTVLVSPDVTSVYVGSAVSDAVAVFGRTTP
jgi:hypothetical protein